MTYTLKYLTPAILRSIENMKLRRPDYSIEDIICDMAAAHRTPWQPLLKEYDEWLSQQSSTDTTTTSGGNTP
jgi:hypothetical protein